MPPCARANVRLRANVRVRAAMPVNVRVRTAMPVNVCVRAAVRVRGAVRVRAAVCTCAPFSLVYFLSFALWCLWGPSAWPPCVTGQADAGRACTLLRRLFRARLVA